jgi:hypothetical protein
LATLNDSLEYSKEGALNEIKNNGENLIMEYKHWSRLGENLRIVCYYPQALLRGSPENPSIKFFNFLIFTITLASLWIGFNYVDRFILGAITVLTVNLTPFFLYEVYLNENVFYLLACGFFIIISLNIKLLFGKRYNNVIYPSILIFISSLIIAFFSEIRGETLIVLGSLILMIIFSKYLKLKEKILLLVIAIVSTIMVKKSIKFYFENLFTETYKLVEESNGHVYTGKRISGHRFWHPVFCGLGDFGKEKGYEWNDRVAYEYALPILNSKYNLDLKYSKDKLHLDNYYDKDSLYYVKFDDLDEYEAIMKEKVVNDIKQDPIWFSKVLLNRIIRTLNISLPFKFFGWLSVHFLLLLLYIKEYEYLTYILSSFPLLFTQIFIYSGDGTTYNSLFSLLSFTIIIYILIKNKLH